MSKNNRAVKEKSRGHGFLENLIFDRIEDTMMGGECYTSKSALQQQMLTLRRAALFAVTLATAATFVCMFSIPLFYNYLQYVHSSMQNEVDFCKQRSRNIWKEISKTQIFICTIGYKSGRKGM
uniref:Col_cuticle_N domain-containing protein n=1 Tax=Elaeophora elaphi TaxID=1147741 RepID=A0A0R3S4G3_9BILA